MKIINFRLFTIWLIGVFMFFGCNEEQEKIKLDVKEANEDMNATLAQYENEWKQFKDNSELAIKENEDKIIELKNEMKKTTKEFKAQYENKILTLEQNNIDLKKKLNEFKYDGKEKWLEFKQEFDDDIDSLATSINEIFKNKK